MKIEFVARVYDGRKWLDFAKDTDPGKVTKAVEEYMKKPGGAWDANAVIRRCEDGMPTHRWTRPAGALMDWSRQDTATGPSYTVRKETPHNDFPEV